MWFVCFVLCGGGFKIRERVCINLFLWYGGFNCLDYFIDLDICNIFFCFVNGGFGNWGLWLVCFKSCEGGYKVRWRFCNLLIFEYGGKNCIGNVL